MIQRCVCQNIFKDEDDDVVQVLRAWALDADNPEDAEMESAAIMGMHFLDEGLEPPSGLFSVWETRFASEEEWQTLKRQFA